MARTLITLIGRSPRTERGYRRTAYTFPDGTRTAPTGMLGWTLAERSPPDRLVVLGTAGSMWDYLVESVEPGTAEEALRLEIVEATEGRRVSQALLDRIEGLVGSALGVHVRLRILPYGRDREEQLGALQIVAEEVGEGDELELDITHGFRHLPLLALMSLLHLEAVKGVTVAAIHYGFYDPDTGEAPVFDLSGLLEIAAWVSALHAFDKDGDYGALGGLLRQGGVSSESCDELVQAAFLERTSRAGEARGRLRRFRMALSRESPRGAAALFAPLLVQRMDWIDRHRLYDRQRALALQYLDTGDPLRAAIYAFEAFITARVSAAGGHPERYEARRIAKERFECDGRASSQFDDYCLLRDLRNALAHGAGPSRGPVTSALASPERLHQTLRGLIERLSPEGGDR